MKYRNFGKLDWEPSALGFGAMRLPILDYDSSRIDEPLAIEMIRYAIDHGVNYVDSAYGYHGGNSERLVGKALKDGYRERVQLATKMPTWLTQKWEDFDRYLDEQLGKLDTDRIDFYLLHGLGFSFHDEFDVLKEIVDYYDGWEVCQIQYNYMDTESSARGPGTKGLRYAASKGLAVVVMEPIQGGRLAITPPPEVQAIWDEAEVKRTPAEWALQWVWNQPEVSLVLSGMSTMQHVIENVESAGRSGPGTLTQEGLGLIKRVQARYLEQGVIGCTNCRYCLPCPEGVAIPDIFAILNENYTSSGEVTKEKYLEGIAPDNRASKCVQCGNCEELCPQQLPIRNLLRGAVRSYESGR
jgi:predicted aldo/keto reductase-like oxidoreductase